MEAYYHRVWCITSWNQDCPQKYQQPQIWRWYQSNGRKWRGAKESLDEGEKADLKLNIQKAELMASCSITSWQINREKVEAVTDLISSGSKTTVDNDYSHEIKRHLLFGRKAKAVTNQDSLLKIKDFASLTEVCIDKAKVFFFSVVMYGYKSWIIKKAEH